MDKRSTITDTAGNTRELSAQEAVEIKADKKNTVKVRYPSYDEFRAKGASRQFARQMVRRGEKHKRAEANKQKAGGASPHGRREKFVVTGKSWAKAKHTRENARRQRQSDILALYREIENAVNPKTGRVHGRLSRKERQSVRYEFDAARA